MAKQSARVWTALVFAGALATQPVSAQNQSQGWPDAGGDAAKAAKPASAVKAAPSVVPAKAAVVAKPVAAPRVSEKPAAPKKAAEATVTAAPAEVAPAPAPKAEPIVTAAPVASDATASEVVTALQQQAELLKRLATEIESQRTVMREQQDKIKALELRATGPAAAAAPAKAVPPPPAITVETGGIKLKVSGLVQGWYSAANTGVVDTFRLRRTELKFSGDMSPRVKWTLMVDPSKTLSLSTTSGSMGGQNVVTGASVSQSGRMLQDAFVSLNWRPYFSVEVGQQKVPLSMEGVQSSGKLDIIERALFMSDKSRGAGYGDVRDLGVMVRGKVLGGQVEYAGGVFNGLGENFNDIDKNEQKTAVMRVIAKPSFIKGLQFGGSVARDRFQVANPTGRERQGLELAYARGIVGIKGELMMGRDAAITRRGGYGQASVRVRKAMTAVFRFDTWDPDTRGEATAATVTERDWLGGVTYTLGNSGVWLQANYIRKTFGGLIKSRDVFTTNVQTAW